MAYSEFQQYLKDGRIDDLVVTESRIIGKIKDAQPGEPSQFVTTRLEPDFANQLQEYGIEYRGGTDENWFSTLLSWVLPALIFVGIWVFLMRRMSMGGLGGGLMSVGKSKAKVYVEKDTKTTMADVAGVEEAKVEIQEVIDFLKDPEGYSKLGARLPRGVLLGRTTRHRQDAAGTRRRRRSWRDVPLDQRLRIRRDVRRRRCGARARSVRSGQEGGALHHLHR